MTPSAATATIAIWTEKPKSAETAMARMASSATSSQPLLFTNKMSMNAPGPRSCPYAGHNRADPGIDLRNATYERVRTLNLWAKTPKKSAGRGSSPDVELAGEEGLDVGL